MKPLILSLSCLFAAMLFAMPTPQEIAAAEPLVQEVMKSEMEALRLNKKTRAQVGAAAFALAKEAQAPAEKYLLLTGAFEQSLRGGAYDEALAALDELKRAIPDFPEKDEFALLDKAVRSISSSKGDALRERHAALAKRINNRARLEKLLEQSKKAPADKPLHFRVATYRVYFDDWASALDEFELSDNASCAAAAKAEKDASTPRSKVADLWWDATPLKPDFLTTALRAHAVSLYRTALSDNTLTGLQRIAAEKRIKEHCAELAAAESSSSAKPTSSFLPAVGTAKYYGVELIGNSVKENKGILSGFANKSYARIKATFDPKDKPIEVVVEFETGAKLDSKAGVFCTALKLGFSPLFINKDQLTPYISSNGSTWNIINGTPIGLSIKPKTKYRVKVSWNREAYAWHIWHNNDWQRIGSISSGIPAFSGTEMQFGTGCVFDCPFSGVIDLSKCYICIDGKLWWEGVRGAYKNANR